jgi:hypothetical protein
MTGLTIITLLPDADAAPAPRTDIADLGKLLLSASGEAACAASRLIEAFTDLSESQRLTRLPPDLIDGLADALHSVLLIEVEAIASQANRLDPQSLLAAEMVGQLTGALTRYLERGA